VVDAHQHRHALGKPLHQPLGDAAAAPPSAASNSRRQMVTVMRPSRARVRKCVCFVPKADTSESDSLIARVPIYFPTTFRSASLILSCQPGPAS
jgi:hypothetical protein